MTAMGWRGGGAGSVRVESAGMGVQRARAGGRRYAEGRPARRDAAVLVNECETRRVGGAHRESGGGASCAQVKAASR